jgi:all-trans-retinol dehydrogenase (NAD+)
MSSSDSLTASSVLTLPLTLLRRAAFEPLVTAPLLLLLLRGPENVRQRLLAPLQSTILSPTSRVHITLPTLLGTLKWLVGLGVASRLNQLLTQRTLNRGYLTRQGRPWNFDKGGAGEVILITGGCAGFGLIMVKMFSQRAPNAQLIVLDRAELPAELKGSTTSLSISQSDTRAYY